MANDKSTGRQFMRELSLSSYKPDDAQIKQALGLPLDGHDDPTRFLPTRPPGAPEITMLGGNNR